MKIRDWNIKAITGYKPITSFYRDFSIAELYGSSAIEDTFNRAFEEWKDNFKYLTELVMVLNWKIHEHFSNIEYDKRADEFCDIYTRLWSETDKYAQDNLEGNELRYFYQTTD